jgi:hypothetical protein
MFAMDGNFTAVHQKRYNALPDTCLTDGDLYMVSEARYQAHLASAVEGKEVRFRHLPILSRTSFRFIMGHL